MSAAVKCHLSERTVQLNKGPVFKKSRGSPMAPRIYPMDSPSNSNHISSGPFKCKSTKCKFSELRCSVMVDVKDVAFRYDLIN